MNEEDAAVLGHLDCPASPLVRRSVVAVQLEGSKPPFWTLRLGSSKDCRRADGGAPFSIYGGMLSKGNGGDMARTGEESDHHLLPTLRGRRTPVA